jgi:hypothetical protein
MPGRRRSFPVRSPCDPTNTPARWLLGARWVDPRHAGLLGPGFPRCPLTEARTESAMTKPKDADIPSRLCDAPRRLCPDDRKRLTWLRRRSAVGETRKLAAILVSDVVGYSRLTGADEDRILARLRWLRRRIRRSFLTSARHLPLNLPRHKMKAVAMGAPRRGLCHDRCHPLERIA